MTDFQITLGLVLLGVAMVAVALAAWGFSGLFDRKSSTGPQEDSEDYGAKLERKNLASKRSHNAH